MNKNLVVIGGGIMGGDIAIAFLAAGWNAHVMTPSRKTRDALPQRIGAGLKQLGVDQSRAGTIRIYSDLQAIDWSHIDLVIEAVAEDLPLKQKIFLEVESLARPDTPIASNTSNFEIAAICAALSRKHRAVGAHFFMPAHLVPLVEVVSGPETSADVAAATCAYLKEIGKAPIWVKKSVPGFVGNRIQHAMMREALYLIEEGVASAEDVDTAVRFGFGFRFLACGPILQKEMSGWDTNCRAGTALYPFLHNETAYPAGIRQMVERGHTGMKALRGFWEWSAESAAAEKERIERVLQASLHLLRDSGSDPAE